MTFRGGRRKKGGILVNPPVDDEKNPLQSKITVKRTVGLAFMVLNWSKGKREGEKGKEKKFAVTQGSGGVGSSAMPRQHDEPYKKKSKREKWEETKFRAL